MTTQTTSRSERILRALRAEPSVPHHTEYFAQAGRCSVAEAVVELMRFERQGLVVTGRGYAGMTWRYDPR